MWTDGIDEVYELTVSHEAYKVSGLLSILFPFVSL